MKIQTTLNHSNRVPSRPESSARPTTQKPSAQLPSESVSIGGEKRINWTDIKELGRLAAGGAIIGGTPVLGASLGVFELAATSTFDGDFSLRGATTLALNAAGTVSLFAGYLPGAALGLGGSALMGAGSFVADNLYGKTLTTTEPK